MMLWWIVFLPPPMKKMFQSARVPPRWRKARPSGRSEHLDNLGSQSPVCHVTRGAGAAAAHLCAVVCRRLCFPGLHKRLTCRTGRTGLRRAGQVRQCGGEGGRRRRGSTSRKETEAWCADTSAPTPTDGEQDPTFKSNLRREDTP